VTSVTYPAFAMETRDTTSLSTATEVVMGRVHIARPASMPETLEEPNLMQDTSSLDQGSDRSTPCGALHLTGTHLDRAEASPGDPLLVTFFWKLATPAEENCLGHLQLLSPSGQQVARFVLPPVRREFPIRKWQAGDVWRGQHLLWLPPDLESGRYEFTLQLCPEALPGECAPDDASANGTMLRLRHLDIYAPERRWTVPDLDWDADVRFGEVAVLLGAILEPGTSVHPGDALKATLVWRAVSETRTSYRVFLHLLNSENAVIAQSDGVPVEWTRPTTGWIAGEILMDPRTLPIPPGASSGIYRLRAGMYTLEDGRLPTSRGDDAVVLGDLEVTPSE
jgi:hypothetical protein